MKAGVAKEGFFKEVKVDLSHNGHIVQKVSQGRQFQFVCRPGGDHLCIRVPGACSELERKNTCFIFGKLFYLMVSIMF